MYLVFRTNKYEKLFKKLLSTHEQHEVFAFEQKLVERPYLGDSLRTPYFLEKKINVKRIYFIINEACQGIAMIRISNKKHQDDVIEEIFGKLDRYQEYIKQLCELDRA